MDGNYGFLLDIYATFAAIGIPPLNMWKDTSCNRHVCIEYCVFKHAIYIYPYNYNYLYYIYMACLKHAVLTSYRVLIIYIYIYIYKLIGTLGLQMAKSRSYIFTYLIMGPKCVLFIYLQSLRGTIYVLFGAPGIIYVCIFYMSSFGCCAGRAQKDCHEVWLFPSQDHQESYQGHLDRVCTAGNCSFQLEVAGVVKYDRNRGKGHSCPWAGTCRSLQGCQDHCRKPACTPMLLFNISNLIKAPINNESMAEAGYPGYPGRLGVQICLRSIR